MSDDFIWATVTAVGPLRIQLDGDTAPLPITPDSLIDPRDLQVGERVRCERSRRRVVIHGRAGGGERVPAGCIMHTAAAVAPNGWLLCNGSNVSRSTYADLFAAIGTTFGAGNGTTTFTLPNLRGRVVVGVDSSQTEFDALGETGGAKTPSHSHALSDLGHARIDHRADANLNTRRVTTPSWAGTARSGLNAYAADSSNRTVGAGLGGTTDAAAASTLQPYIVLTPIIKT